MEKFEIIQKRKIWYLISGIIIALGFIMMMVNNGLNLGIDFTGGTMIQIDLQQEFSTSEITSLLEPFELNPTIQTAGIDQKEVIIKTGESLSNDERMEIYEVFKTEYNLESDEYSVSQFSPSVGDELKSSAVMAIIIAAACMLVYITLRFEFVFAVSAIIALVHDILVLISVYAIFNLTIDSSFIAAILTIVGYSINDTIVVFDRVRENIKREKKKSFEEIANISIGQTLRRSIFTSFTTLLVIGSLYVLGVESIKVFALPLMCGVLVGTYSSIFIASPNWVLIRNKISKKNGNAYSK